MTTEINLIELTSDASRRDAAPAGAAASFYSWSVARDLKDGDAASVKYTLAAGARGRALRNHANARFSCGLRFTTGTTTDVTEPTYAEKAAFRARKGGRA
jgi:hypothetical protein